MGQSSDPAPATQCHLHVTSLQTPQLHWGQRPGFVATSGQAVDQNSGCKWGSDSVGSHEDSCSWEGHLGVWLLAGTQSSMAPTCHLTRAPKISTFPGGARMGGQLGDQACTHQLSKAQNSPGLLGGCWGPTSSPDILGKGNQSGTGCSRGMEMVRPQVSLRTGHHSEDEPALRPAYVQD